MYLFFIQNVYACQKLFAFSKKRFSKYCNGIEKVKDKNSLEEIKKEYKILKEIQTSSIEITGKIKDLFQSVKNVNVKLWNTEDKLRICEKNKDFDKNFIELARGVYFANDERAELKSKINKILKSNIIEIKQYDNYKI